MLSKISKVIATATISFLLLTFVTTPIFAQENTTTPTVQQLLEKIKKLHQQLAEQQQQNKMLANQLQQLQEIVSELAKTQQKQQEKIAKIPEKMPESSVRTGGKEKVTIKGFISASYMAEDQNFAFSNGQNGQFPVPPEFNNSRWFSGGDVRNSRLTMIFQGPKLKNGWTAGATLEGDFFGGFNGSGAFSHQQLTPRLRLAFVDLKKGGTTIRIGQAWSPLFGEFPESLTHIAFPLGWASAGGIGWRFPGVFLYQDISSPGAKTKVQFQAAVFEGSWSGPGNNLSMGTAGNVGFKPQVEARLNISGKTEGGNAWKMYAVGHWDKKDLEGVNNINPGLADSSLTGSAFEVGGKIRMGSFLIHGNAYVSKALGQQLTAITQFGDIQDWGAWLQLGYEFTPEWSVFGFYGICDPDDQDVLKWVGDGGRVKNQQYHVMVKRSLGQYALSLEWLHDTVSIGPDAVETDGNQIAFSAIYKF